MFKNNLSCIPQIVLAAIGLLFLNCGGSSQANVNGTVCDKSDTINIKDTALIESIIDSVYASDKIDWPHDFDDLDTLDLVLFAAVKAHIPSMDPESMTETFGPCVEERIVRFDDLELYESAEAIKNGWTKEIGIETELYDANYDMCYDELIPVLSRINGRFGIAYKMWNFDNNHFIRMYYLSSDSTLIPIDGDIIHKAHPALEME